MQVSGPRDGRPGARSVLHCEIHGPLKHRPDQGIWVCVGFEGEPCLNLPGGVSQASYERISTGISYYPGIWPLKSRWPRP